MRGNTTVTNLTYDPVSRLSSLDQNLSGTAQDVTLGYTYAPSSQIATNTRNNGIYSWSGSSGSPLTYANDGLNRLTGITGLGVSTTLGYHGRSNVTSVGPSSYGYTIENLLTSGPSTTLSYDPLLRLYQESGAATTQFQYNGQEMVTEYDTGGTVQRRYVFGGGIDEPLVWYEGSGAGDRRWLHTDERGSVIAISNGSAVSIATNTYDEYGIPAASNMGRFGYTGQAWLPDLRLWYYKARVYNPALGRFMQADPLGYDSRMNIYAYVGGDPVNLSDPSGLAFCGINFDVVRVDPDPPGTIIVVCDRQCQLDARLDDAERQFLIERYITALLIGNFGSEGNIRPSDDPAQQKDNSTCRPVSSGNTVQVGLSGQGTFGIFSYQVAVGVAFDSHGNVALYESLGPGGGVGGGGAAGLSLQGSNAPTVQDLGGAFANGSGGGGLGIGGTVDGFRGYARNGQPIVGGGVTAGAAGGETSFGGVTNTFVSPSLNLLGRPTC